MFVSLGGPLELLGGPLELYPVGKPIISCIIKQRDLF